MTKKKNRLVVSASLNEKQISAVRVRAGDVPLGKYMKQLALKDAGVADSREFEGTVGITETK